MESRRANTELSRVVNGNFASALGGWEGDFETQSLIHEPHEHWAFNEAPRTNENPVYYIVLKDSGIASVAIPYRDLSVFPSVLRFLASQVYPRDYEAYVVRASPYGSPPYPQPFGYWNGTAWEYMEVGSAFVLDAPDTYGEYRIQEVLTNTDVIAVPTTNPPAPAVSGASASYYRQAGNLAFAVNLPTPYTRTGDYFVCKSPSCGGQIYGVSGNTIFVVCAYGQQPPPPTYTTGSPVLGALEDWKIFTPIPLASASILRSLPVALYDLTLAYDVRSTGSTIDPGMVRINLLDELDQTMISLFPSQIDGTAVFIDRPAVTGEFKRRTQRFLREIKYPVYGKARAYFTANPAGGLNAALGNVVLYRGNYVEKILSSGSEKVDFTESEIQMDAEIIPKGTIIAYAGDSACPPGFIMVEGIGGEQGDVLGQGPSLRDKSIEPGRFILSATLDQRTSRNGKTDPRTIVFMDRDELDHHIMPGAALSYQRSKRLVNIIPFRYDLGHHLYGDLITMRTGHIRDPHPEWVVDEYDRTDIVPGCIIEFLWAKDSYNIFRKRAYAIVSQFASGQFIDHFVEQTPTHPFGADSDNMGEASDDRRRAIRQVNVGGSDSNRVYSGYGMHGTYAPVYEDRAIMELVGDWVSVVTAIKADTDAMVQFWKSGVIAHAQTHPELGDDDAYGGYGLLAEPHSHDISKSGDVEVLSNIDPGSPNYSTQVPTRHRHGVMFGAATLPKVRPVLLCQKI